MLSGILEVPVHVRQGIDGVVSLNGQVTQFVTVKPECVKKTPLQHNDMT